MRINSLREVHVFLLTDREVRFNGIHLRDRCEHCCWTDKISDLHLSESRDPIYQGCNIGEAEVEVRLFHLSLGSLYRRFRCEVCLDIVVQLALSNGALLGQRSIAVDIELSLAQVGLGLRELRFGLIKHCLERTRVDLEKHLTLAYKRTFLVGLADDVSSHLRLNLCIDVAVERSHPLAVDGDIFLHHGGNFHLGGLWRRSSVSISTTRE